MADRFAKVCIAGIWLTANSTEDAPACRCVVQNESAFASSNVSNSESSLNFTVHTQVAARGLKDIPFTVLAPYCAEAVLGLIVGQMDAALAALSTVRVISQSLTNFDVEATPVMQEGGALFSFESRSGGIAKGVRLQFISTGAGGA